MSIRRINRFEQERGFVTAQGIKRVARARDVSGLDSVVAAAEAQKPLRVIENAQQRLLVVVHAKGGELATLDREVIYVARALAELQTQTEVHVLVLGQPSEHLDWAGYGVDQVHVADDPTLDQYVPQAKVALIQTLHRQLKPQRVLFVESELGDSDLARRFACAAELSFAGDLFEITDTGVRRTSGNGRYQAQGPLADVLAIESGTTGDLDLEFVSPAGVAAAELPQPEMALAEDRFSLPSQDIPLVEADFVISAGNGVQDMETFHRLAQLLGATVGGSRVVVDDGKLPRERQVGATGQIVKASVYLAIGISGAVQHLQGIKDCNTVIAVNHDESCDMIKRADVSIIADAQEWMLSMIAQLEEAAA